MKQYLNQLQYILDNGEKCTNERTGTGTIWSCTVPEAVYDLSKGFPLVTTKKMFLKGVIVELLWMLSGDTNVKTLQEQGVHIWDLNYSQFTKQQYDGDLGPIYGQQWRGWKEVREDHWSCETGAGVRYSTHHIDQISNLIDSLKNNPGSRRHIVSAWNVTEINDMSLPPCHCFFQCFVRKDKYLDLKLYQRSADMFLGVPFNIASYSLLLMMLAQQTGLKPGKFIHSLGNAHIYLNHIDQVKEQLSREPLPRPTMEIDKAEDMFSYKLEDFHLKDYQFHPAIKGELS